MLHIGGLIVSGLMVLWLCKGVMHMTELKPKKRPREELTLKQKVYIGIAVTVLFIILFLKVLFPQFALMEGRRLTKQINEVIRTDHFELIGSERKGLWGMQFFASFQSTNYEDLVISSDMAPRHYTSQAITYLYERAVTQKAPTIRRFDMATSDILYDALKPEMDELLRIMGEFGREAPETLELDEEYQFGKLQSWVPTIDINAAPSDEKYLEYLEIVLDELDSKNYGYAGVNILFTPDRKERTTYSWIRTDEPMTVDNARKTMADYRNKVRAKGFSIQTGLYYDFPYNHGFTIPTLK